MTKTEILATIKNLSTSQGFYSMLYRELMRIDKQDRERCLSFWESKNFKDSVDLIMYLEG